MFYHEHRPTIEEVNLSFFFFYDPDTRTGSDTWLEPVANPEKYLKSSFGGQASFDDGAAALRRQGLGKLVLSNKAVSDREVGLQAGGVHLVFRSFSVNMFCLCLYIYCLIPFTQLVNAHIVFSLV